MRVRVRVRLRTARARACVRASVVRAGPREQARGAKPDADGFRWLAACCTVLQLVVLQRVRELCVTVFDSECWQTVLSVCVHARGECTTRVCVMCV